MSDAINRAADISSLMEMALNCKRCGLRQGCNQVVFGDGVPTARLMVIGEGPGADEDRLGKPFVGKAGQLLDRILACGGFSRSDNVYIANIVKCRPPGNRIPCDAERDSCMPWLKAQIALVDPVIILLLGATALQGITEQKIGITKYRGNWIQKEGRWMMPTYHPAALLRNPNLKRDVWEDMKKVVAKYREIVDPDHHSDYC